MNHKRIEIEKAIWSIYLKANIQIALFFINYLLSSSSYATWSSMYNKHFL